MPTRRAIGLKPCALRPVFHCRQKTVIMLVSMRPANPPIQVPGNTPFQKMDNLFRAVIAVPKAEIDKREKEWKRARKNKRTKKN
jgi:hypothetical protein